MRFKVGDVIIINNKGEWKESPYINIPLEIKKIEGGSYYIDPDIINDGDTGYLFQEGSAWCAKATKANHYKTKLGRILYGKRY